MSCAAGPAALEEIGRKYWGTKQLERGFAAKRLPTRGPLRSLRTQTTWHGEHRKSDFHSRYLVPSLPPVMSEWRSSKHVSSPISSIRDRVDLKLDGTSGLY